MMADKSGFIQRWNYEYIIMESGITIQQVLSLAGCIKGYVQDGRSTSVGHVASVGAATSSYE